MISARYALTCMPTDQNLIEPIGNSLGCGLFISNVNCGPGAFVRGSSGRKSSRLPRRCAGCLRVCVLRSAPERAHDGVRAEAWLRNFAARPPPPHAACAIRTQRGPRQRANAAIAPTAAPLSVMINSAIPDAYVGRRTEGLSGKFLCPALASYVRVTPVPQSHIAGTQTIVSSRQHRE